MRYYHASVERHGLCASARENGGFRIGNFFVKALQHRMDGDAWTRTGN